MSEDTKQIRRYYHVFKNETYYQKIIDGDIEYYRWQSSDNTKILIKKVEKTTPGSTELYTNTFALDLWDNRTSATYIEIR